MGQPQPNGSPDGTQKIALISLSTGLILLLAILFNAHKAEREGNEQLRNDSYLALISPVVFFGIGGKLLQAKPATQRRNNAKGKQKTLIEAEENINESRETITLLQSKTAKILERAYTELSNSQRQNNTLIQNINTLYQQQQQAQPPPTRDNSTHNGIEPLRQALANAIADHNQLEATALQQSAQFQSQLQNLQDDARSTASRQQVEQQQQQQRQKDQLAATQVSLQALQEQLQQAHHQRQHLAQQQQASLLELKQSIDQQSQKQEAMQTALAEINTDSPAAVRTLQQSTDRLQHQLHGELEALQLGGDEEQRSSLLASQLLQSHGDIAQLQEQAQQLQDTTNTLLSQQASLVEDQHQQLSALKTELLLQLEGQLNQGLERLQRTQEQQQNDHHKALQNAQASQHQLLQNAQRAEGRLQQLQIQLQQAELGLQQHLKVMEQRIDRGNSSHAQAIAAIDAQQQKTASAFSDQVDQLQHAIDSATGRFHQLQTTLAEQSAAAKQRTSIDSDALQSIHINLERLQADLTRFSADAEALWVQTTASFNAEVKHLASELQTMAQHTQSSLRDQKRTFNGLQQQLDATTHQLHQQHAHRQTQTQRTHASLAELEGNAKAIHHQLSTSQQELEAFQQQYRQSIESLRSSLQQTTTNLQTVQRSGKPSTWPEPTSSGGMQGQHYLLACQALAIAPDSPWPVVRETWRRNVKRWHPDQGGDQQAWMHRQAAYQLLEAWHQFDQP